jgi:hypothetical protein
MLKRGIRKCHGVVVNVTSIPDAAALVDGMGKGELEFIR